MNFLKGSNVQAIKLSISGIQKINNFYKRLEKETCQRSLEGWAEKYSDGVIEAFIQGEKNKLNGLLIFLLNYLNDQGIKFSVFTCAPIEKITKFRLLSSIDEKKDMYSCLKVKNIHDIYVSSYQRTIKEDSLHLQRLARRLNENGKYSKSTELLLRNVAPGQMREDIVKSMVGKYKNVGSSFSSLLSSQTQFRKYVKRTIGSSLEWDVNDKLKGVGFAKKLHIKVPDIYQEKVSFSEILFSRDCILKPSSGAGSVGVFVVKNSGNDIFEVKSNSRVGDAITLKKHIENMLLNGEIKNDRWNVEELLVGEDEEIPRDLKFYTFYGKVGLILEVSRGKETKYCFYDENLLPVNTGKYKDKELEAGVIPREYMNLAVKLSKKIPAPMVRIDFLKTKGGPVFGEFTPRPGGFDKFNVDTDRMLGEKFIEAQASLFTDLLKGEKFSDFFAAVE